MHIHWQVGLIIAAMVGLLLIMLGYFYEWVGTRRDARSLPAPGRLVSVGTHRLHLLCRGSLGPTVVIEQGAGELSRFWWPLQDEIAEFARVCTYDRAGYGWSDPGKPRRTVSERTEELHTLLRNAKIPEPYIFVAHSYGGMIVRDFAEKYPDEVAGLVLVDTPAEISIFDRDVLAFYAKARMANRVAGIAARLGVLRVLRKWVALDNFGFWLTRPEEYSALCDDLLSVEQMPEMQRVPKAAESLGALPIIVITHGRAFPGPFAVLEKNWREGQKNLAALSTNGKVIVAENSNHMVQQDEPEVVIDSVRRLHTPGDASADRGATESRWHAKNKLMVKQT